MNENFDAYKSRIMAASGFVLALGFAEFVASCIVASTSGGNYVGGVYCGILCMGAGIAGFRSDTRNQINWILGLSIAAIITSIIACAVQAAYFNFFNDLDACSSYESGEPNTCAVAGYGAGFQCYGNSDAYAGAEACAANWQFNNGDSSYECSCVTTTDSTTTCYNFGNVQSCEKFTNDLPGQIYSSYVIAFMCLVAANFLCCYASAASRSAIDEPMATQEVTVVQATLAAPIVVYATNPAVPANAQNNKM